MDGPRLPGKQKGSRSLAHSLTHGRLGLGTRFAEFVSELLELTCFPGSEVLGVAAFPMLLTIALICAPVDWMFRVEGCSGFYEHVHMGQPSRVFQLQAFA